MLYGKKQRATTPKVCHPKEECQPTQEKDAQVLRPMKDKKKQRETGSDEQNPTLHGNIPFLSFHPGGTVLLFILTRKYHF
jgi:hypothetical protein